MPATAENQVMHIATPQGFVANDWLDRPRFLASDLIGGEGEGEKPASQPAKEGGVASEGVDRGVLVGGVVECGPETEAEGLVAWLPHITAIEIRFPSAFDGRGFSIARRLRQLGYQGEMRAVGRLHIDQFRHALLCGMNGVGLTEAVAKRMPESHWVKAAETAGAEASYQARLGVREG
ncbi:MAG: DUF934 domain-containing protein [Proteobacteria bacterium]|nr:DUF934 domain-containing protein [Pseudomonadota bacterium]